MSATMRLPWRKNASPASVRLRRRVVRRNKRAPSRSSSRDTSLLTAEGVSPMALAAAVNPPASATLTKASKSLAMLTIFPY